MPRKNVTGDPVHHWCPWCENTGWVYLRHFTARRVVRVKLNFGTAVKNWARTHNVTFPLSDENRARLGQLQKDYTVTDRWAEQVLAPCIACEQGERLHRKYPSMPVQYGLEDIDVSLPDHTLSRLPADIQSRYHAARRDPQRIIKAYEAAMVDAEPDVLEYLAVADGPGPGYNAEERATGLIPTLTQAAEEIEDP